MSGVTAIAGALVLLLSTAGEVAFAQGMADPTRPPSRVLQGEAAEDTVRKPVLQSIIIGRHGRTAIINGQRVELGGRYGDARVDAITETTVVLRSSGGTEVLRLYPDVYMKTDKRPAESARKNPRERN
jgi:MSHA biogenesis protein MshK